MILEGLVTTLAESGEAHVAPMGALVEERITELVLRPYRSSQTYANLKRTRQGVLHVTDDVELLARAAIGRLTPLPELVRAEQVEGWIIADACRWFEFHVISLDDRAERTTIACRVVCQGRKRDFFGFNRGKHAVVEAAILATRVHLLPPEDLRQEFRHLAVLVEKTGGAQERRAWQILEQYVAEQRPSSQRGAGVRD